MPPDAPSASSSPGARSRRSTSSPASSPEFEFWRGSIPDGFSSAEPLHSQQLVSADELFVDGVILPLDLFPTSHQQHQQPPSLQPWPAPTPLPLQPDTSTAPVAAIPDVSEPSPAAITHSTCSSGNPAGSSSKRWKDIFRGMTGVGTGEKKEEVDVKGEEKKRRRERRTGSFGAGVGGAFGGAAASAAPAAAELNINIWPFSRSRSAGTSGSARQKGVVVTGGAAGRKVSSAPCSRSNSRGESSSKAVAAMATAVGASSSAGGGGGGCRRWASSPGRGGSLPAGGIHVGRASPVWQIRKGSGSKKGAGSEVETASGSGNRRSSSGGKEKKTAGNETPKSGSNTSTTNTSTCRDEEKNVVNGGTAAATGSHLSAFTLRALFSRKVLLT